MKKLLTLILLLFLLPIAMAQSDVTSWENLGGDDQTFKGGSGQFGNLANIGQKGVSISTPQFTPLVVDMDNDGINEIVMVDGISIRVFQNSTLQGLGSISTGINSADKLSNIIAYDIDDDGFTEILTAGQPLQVRNDESGLLLIINLTSGAPTIEKTLNYSQVSALRATTGNPVDLVIGCSADSCLMVHSRNDDSGSGRGLNLTAIGFDYNGFGDPVTISQNSGGTRTWCLSQPKHIAIGDFDNSGTENFAITAVDVQGGGAGDSLELHFIKVSGTTASSFSSTTVVDFQDQTPSFNGCENILASTGNVLGYTFSSPTLHNFQTGATEQAIIAYMTDPDEFRLGAYDNTGGFIARFPAILEGEGILISNVMRGDFYPDSVGDDNDFCASGYDENGNELEVVCGSFDTGESNIIGGNTKRYQINVTIAYNISSVINQWHTFAMSADHDGEKFAPMDTTGTTVSLDEIVTPYGIYKLRHEETFADLLLAGCDTAGNCELEEVYVNPKQKSGSILSIDEDEDTQDELLMATSTNLFYFDLITIDNVTTIPDSSIFTNPCLDSALQLNTTFLIEFDVVDQDEEAFKDEVDAKVIFYHGSTNEYTVFNEGGKQASGSTFSFQTTLNKTIASGTIRIVSNDTGSLQEVNTDISFQVADQGIEFGECTQTGGFIDEVVVVQEGQIVDAEGNPLNNNTINRGVAEYSELLGVGGSIVWILLMLFLGLSIILTPTIIETATGKNLAINFNGLIAITFMFETFMIVLGALLGVLGVGLIILFSVIMLTSLGIWVARLFTRTDNPM